MLSQAPVSETTLQATKSAVRDSHRGLGQPSQEQNQGLLPASLLCLRLPLPSLPPSLAPSLRALQSSPFSSCLSSTLLATLCSSWPPRRNKSKTQNNACGGNYSSCFPLFCPLLGRWLRVQACCQQWGELCFPVCVPRFVSLCMPPRKQHGPIYHRKEVGREREKKNLPPWSPIMNDGCGCLLSALALPLHLRLP